MPDDRRKFSRTGTGTVPKIKCRNNTTQSNPPEFLRNLSNNLDLAWQRQDFSCRNPSRNFGQLNQYQMETTEDRRQNESLNVQGTNGTLSAPSTSGSTSRRDSAGTIPKCDNVKKCPDKKQIEDKLNQIREYLQVTTSLMSSIKNNEDQSAVNERSQFEVMIKDLKDSEKKLLVLLNDPLFDDSDEVDQTNEENHNMDVAVSEHMQKFSQLLDILACQQDKINNIYNTNNGSVENGVDNISEAGAYERNELEEKVEFTNRKVQLLREQQTALMNLKMKAENQLKDAKLAQENLLRMQQSQKSANEMINGTNGEQALSDSQQIDKNSIDGHIDSALEALSDKLQHLRQCASVRPENIQMNDDYLQETFENNHQLLHILDNRDTELNSEHLEMQQKFNDLQTKKLQIDQLAQQLQTFGDEDDEDIGSQVRKIVTMKQQLSSLKDLLDVVKNTEYSLAEAQNVNGANSTETQENTAEMRTKQDNIRQEDRSKRNQNERRPRPENIATRSNSNEQWIMDKSNKSLLKVQEQEKVLAELKAKKRELEEIMYKQKDRSSINNDVFSETSVNKSEMSTNNMFDNVTSWLPAQPMQQHNHITSVYSSDDCPEEDINEFSDLNSTTDIGNIPQPQPLLNSNYSTSSFGKRRDEFQRRFDVNFTGDFTQQSSTQTSERLFQTDTPVFTNRICSNNPVADGDNNRSQVQKQLELIQSVCQSLLDQQSSNNVQQLRNNLTPSPLYTEPRSFPVSNPRQNAAPANLVNPTTETSTYINPQLINPQYFAMNEVTNNQNMLTANTLQTQAFLLNTLNQCCQMLWFQQREIASLRSTVSLMQNRMEQQPEQDLNTDPSSSYLFPNRPISSLSSFQSPQRNATNNKANQVSSACSLPNLNPLGVHANMENAYTSHNNVIRSSPSARLLEATLNNMAPIHGHHNLGNEPINNTVLPSVNTNVNMGQPLPSQIWNGTALNNQVAPGNRANNYWDNFRSYSRQNLLSTSSKSNEVLQNLPSLPTGVEHSNDRPLFSLPPTATPKLNLGSKQASNVPEESIPRQIFFKGSQNSENSRKPMAAIPPDVLNINHSVSNSEKMNERYELTNQLSASPFNDPLPDTTETTNATRNTADSFKDGHVENRRNRNEWTTTEQADSSPKSKLFEELRDNVYKEVANLISANVNRPHFLIQLFRDLQQINSDPLRGRTLQSIQSVITNSLSAIERTGGASRQASGPAGHVNLDQTDPDFLVLQAPIWPTQPLTTAKAAQPMASNFEPQGGECEVFNLPQSVTEFINSHTDVIFDEDLIDLLKQFMVEEISRMNGFVENANNILKRYSAIFVKAFDKYKGRRIADISDELLLVISNILVVDFSILCILEDYSVKVYENMGALTNTELPTQHSNGLSLNLTSQINSFVEETGTPQMQNGDLAEADQSHLEVQEEEEEGAVGGVMNIFLEANYNAGEFADANIADLPKIDAPVNAECDAEFSEQGLDQVPTRLTTNSRSHSNTPSRGCNSSKSDSLEHF